MRRWPSGPSASAVAEVADIGVAPPSVIEIRLRSISQLFNSFDPTPFPEKDLDDDAEEFIVGWARELHTPGRLRIVVHLPDTECATEAARTLGEAIAQHFTYRADVMGRELRELFRSTRLYLAVGLSVFAACMLAAQTIRNLFPDNVIANGVEQGLIIVGWVANWKPFDLLLYEWWPLRRRMQLFRRLADAEVEIQPTATPRS